MVASEESSTCISIASGIGIGIGIASPSRVVMAYLSTICLFGVGHCFATWSATASSVYCYAAALAYTVSVSIQRSRLGEHGHATHLLPVKRMRWFPTFLSFSYLCRIAWLLLSDMHAFEWVNGKHAALRPQDAAATGDDSMGLTMATTAGSYQYEHMVIRVPLLPTSIDMYVLGVTSFGKLATLLSFSAFTLLLRFWQDVLHLARRADKPLARIAANQSFIAEYTRTHPSQSLGRARTVFVVANVWIYLLEFALLVLKTLFPHQESVIFQADYGVVALFFLLLAVMLARCALQLRAVLLKIEFSALAAGLARRVTWLGAGCALVFFCRSLLLLIATPSIDVFDPHVSNPWLFYTVWELFPGLLVISSMTVKKKRVPTGAAANGSNLPASAHHANTSSTSGKPIGKRHVATEASPLLPLHHHPPTHPNSASLVGPRDPGTGSELLRPPRYGPRRESDETVSPFEGQELRI